MFGLFKRRNKIDSCIEYTKKVTTQMSDELKMRDFGIFLPRAETEFEVFMLCSAMFECAARKLLIPTEVKKEFYDKTWRYKSYSLMSTKSTGFSEVEHEKLIDKLFICFLVIIKNLKFIPIPMEI